MNVTLNEKIKEESKIIIEKQKFLTTKINDFIYKSEELVGMSYGKYRLEKNVILNKISIKHFVLNSHFCVNLKLKNVVNYTLSELRLMLVNNSVDESSQVYLFALELYEYLENIEDMIKENINYQINFISNSFFDIKVIDSIEKNEYQNLYINIIDKIKNEYLELKEIETECYEICISIVNDIFHFYMNDYINFLETKKT